MGRHVNHEQPLIPPLPQRPLLVIPDTPEVSDTPDVHWPAVGVVGILAVTAVLLTMVVTGAGMAVAGLLAMGFFAWIAFLIGKCALTALNKICARHVPSE